MSFSRTDSNKVVNCHVGLRQMTDGVDKDSGIIEREKDTMRGASRNAEVQLMQLEFERIRFTGKRMLLGLAGKS